MARLKFSFSRLDLEFFQSLGPLELCFAAQLHASKAAQLPTTTSGDLERISPFKLWTLQLQSCLAALFACLAPTEHGRRLLYVMEKHNHCNLSSVTISEMAIVLILLSNNICYLVISGWLLGVGVQCCVFAL